jgi:hypothetical protein
MGRIDVVAGSPDPPDLDSASHPTGRPAVAGPIPSAWAIGRVAGQLDRSVHGAETGHGQDGPAPAGSAAIVRRAVGRRARAAAARPRGVLFSHTPADLGTLAMVVITLARRLRGGRRGGRALRVCGGRRDRRGLRLLLTGAQRQEEDRNGSASHKARRSRIGVHVGVPSKGRAPRGRHVRVRGGTQLLGVVDRPHPGRARSAQSAKDVAAEILRLDVDQRPSTRSRS